MQSPPAGQARLPGPEGLSGQQWVTSGCDFAGRGRLARHEGRIPPADRCRDGRRPSLRRHGAAPADDLEDLTSVQNLFNVRHTEPKGAINALIDGNLLPYDGRDSIPHPGTAADQ